MSIIEEFLSQYDPDRNRMIKQLLDSFVAEYHIDRISRLTLGEYNQTGNHNTFCYRLEKGLVEYSSMGNVFPNAYGVYIDAQGCVKVNKTLSKKYGVDPDIAFSCLKSEIVRLLELGYKQDYKAINGIELDQRVKFKLLSVYYPEKFFPVCAMPAAKDYCKCFSIFVSRSDTMMDINRKLESWRNEHLDSTWSLYQTMALSEWMRHRGKIIDPFFKCGTEILEEGDGVIGGGKETDAEKKTNEAVSVHEHASEELRADRKESGNDMSKIQTGSISIYDAMTNIKAGKYAMPAFQRQYVWSMHQIEKLWDSLLLDYPVASFLFWHLDDNNIKWDTYFCDFLKKAIFNSTRQSDCPNYEIRSIDVRTTDTGILDGQQRLTSLFLSLCGEICIREKFARKKNGEVRFCRLYLELDQNRIEDSYEEFNSMKHGVSFSGEMKAGSTQFDISKVMREEFHDKTRRQESIENCIHGVSENSKEYARTLLNKLCEKVYDEKIITYTEIFDMMEDDALEMFVRFNSGGKALSKSQITMSILEVYWPNAKTEFGKLLSGSYENFSNDFIIRTALMLYANVTQFRIDRKIVDDLKNNWNDFKGVLIRLEKVLKQLRIDLRRFERNWNILIPIIYTLYNNPDYDGMLEGIQTYIVRAELFIFFRSGAPGKLQKMKGYIRENNFMLTKGLLDEKPEFRVTEGRIEDILSVEKNNRITEEILYLLSRDWYNGNLKYELDHLHPASRFNDSNPLGVSVSDWNSWRKVRDTLPNLNLMEGRSNASKSAESLQAFYDDMNDEQKQIFRNHAMIPDGVSLELKDFGQFYEKRKEALRGKIRELLN